MATYKYVKYCDFDRIIREDDLHYIILDEDGDEMYLTKYPNDVIETRTYLPEGTTVLYYNQITTIKYVDINDFDLPYLIDLENDERWCKYNEIKEINY